MKFNMVLGSSLVALTASTGTLLVSCTHLANQPQPAFNQQPATVYASQPAQSKPAFNQQPATVYASQPAQSQPAKSFENLSMCEQLDTIAKGGKSVAQFIVNSGRYSQFAANVKANCNWHTEQLNQAYAILNPPRIAAKPKVNSAPLPQPTKCPGNCSAPPLQSPTNRSIPQQPPGVNHQTTVINNSPTTHTDNSVNNIDNSTNTDNSDKSINTDNSDNSWNDNSINTDNSDNSWNDNSSNDNSSNDNSSNDNSWNDNSDNSINY